MRRPGLPVRRTATGRASSAQPSAPVSRSPGRCGTGRPRACSWWTSRPRRFRARRWRCCSRHSGVSGAAGLGVIYVSHRLDEIFAIGDRVTVLRDGVRVGTWDVADIDQDDLVRSMIGGEELRPPHDQRSTRADGRGRPGGLRPHGTVVDNVDLEARRGEVVGIAGLTGSGREEILPLIFGVASRVGRGPPGRPAGSCSSARRHAGRSRAGPRGPPRRGCGPGDARCARTSASPTCGRFSTRLGYLSRAAETKEAEAWITRLDVRPARSDAIFGAAVRRQPAEGRAGEVAPPTARGAPARRAQPGRRRRRQGGHPRPRPRGGAGRRQRRHRVVRRRRALRHLRPRARHARRPHRGARSRGPASPPKSSVASSSAWQRAPSRRAPMTGNTAND